MYEVDFNLNCWWSITMTISKLYLILLSENGFPFLKMIVNVAMCGI